MSEDDKLFNFVSGLQPWAQLELKRQKVSDLLATLVAADALVDFKPTGGSRDEGIGKKFQGSKGSNRDGKEKQFHGSKPTKKFGNFRAGSISRFADVAKSGCFLCKGPHRARDCPMKAKVSAMMASEDQEQGEEMPIARASTLQILGALRAGSSVYEKADLMHVPCVVNGRRISALVDTGATHNFVSKEMALELGLKTGIDTSKVKAVNS